MTARKLLVLIGALFFATVHVQLAQADCAAIEDSDERMECEDGEEQQKEDDRDLDEQDEESLTPVVESKVDSYSYIESTMSVTDVLPDPVDRNAEDLSDAMTETGIVPADDEWEEDVYNAVNAVTFAVGGGTTNVAGEIAVRLGTLAVQAVDIAASAQDDDTDDTDEEEGEDDDGN